MAILKVLSNFFKIGLIFRGGNLSDFFLLTAGGRADFFVEAAGVIFNLVNQLLKSLLIFT